MLTGNSSEGYFQRQTLWNKYNKVFENDKSQFIKKEKNTPLSKSGLVSWGGTGSKAQSQTIF